MDKDNLSLKEKLDMKVKFNKSLTPEDDDKFYEAKQLKGQFNILRFLPVDSVLIDTDNIEFERLDNA